MDKKRKINTNRVAAYALSGVMLASMVPYNVFATQEKAQNPCKICKGFVKSCKNNKKL